MIKTLESDVKLNLPKQDGFLLFLPVLDLFVLVFVFALLMSRFTMIGGHKVELTGTSSRIPAAEHAVVLEVLPGEPLQLWMNKEKVSVTELEAKLAEEEQKWTYGGQPVIMLKLDKALTLAQSSAVKNTILQSDFSIWVVEQFHKK